MTVIRLRRTRAALSTSLLLAAASNLNAQQAAQVPAPFASLTKSVSAGINGDRAFKTVDYVQRYFRLPGNRGFDLAIDTVAALLRAAGYEPDDKAAPNARLVYRIESRTMPQPAWSPLDGRLTIAGSSTPLQAFATNLNMLAINSGSTPDAGVTADVIDVGDGADADFAKVDVKDRIVLSTGQARTVFPRAMAKGAIGLLVTQKLPAYNQQSKNRTAIQFTSVPRDTIRNGWAIFISTATLDALRAAQAKGPLRVHALVRTVSERRPERTIVAEIRGASKPAERFVYSAHVQEPGANDNASGVGALAEMARVAADLVKRNVANPQRTITFLWGDEIRATDRFLKEDSTRRAGVKWGMSLDMVGENTALTGGTFLIEKMPDPSAVWVRGEDQHTEWGGRALEEKDIRAHWFNDFVRSRCLDRARDTQWVVKANPFEGGSDHTPFLTAQIPAVLLWHFTDQFYHTDLDRISMVSATTLGNVGSCALTTGLLLADGSAAVVRGALDELATTAEQAIRTQAALSRDTLSRGGAKAHEQHILDVWRDFYLSAIDKITDIATAPLDLTKAIDDAKRRVRAATPTL